ncbi:MAG: GDSL-type esterase/lipase family protein [Anaerohalosphaeraceae bacterium]
MSSSIKTFKRKTRAFWIFVFLLVSALNLAQTFPVRPDDYPEKIRIACVGDSITYGMKIDNRQENSYPAQLQKLLGGRYEVKNFGCSGARVSMGTTMPYLEQPEYRSAMSFKPHVVIICIGINDASVPEWQKNKPHFTQDYKDLIQRFQNVSIMPAPKIWLASLLPVVPPYEPYVEIQKTKAEADVLIRQLADALNLPVIDLNGPLISEPQFIPDGLHPDKNGAAIIARTVARAVTGDYGGLAMPWVFGNHMVLQRQMPIPIFGTANVGSAVSVKLGSTTIQTIADANGRWRVDLPAMEAGGPYELVCLDTSRTLTFTDVLVGEVWYAAGQSNMDWPCQQDADWKNQASLADNYPQIRLLNRQGNPSTSAVVWTQEQIERVTVDAFYNGSWQVCSRESAAPISAVAYYYARNIYHAAHVPVGIIESAVGGASMEAFMPPEALITELLYPLTKQWIDASAAPDWHRARARQNLGAWFDGPHQVPMPHHPFEPSFLFNADTADLIPFAIRGVIWYQGETNATDASNQIAWDPHYNQRLFEALIQSWRRRWGQGDFPFYYVQLPNLNRPWMLFREMQFRMLNTLPNLGMAVTMDLGHPTNVHPSAKREVARRLSLWAQAHLYGQISTVCSGPLYNGAFQKEGTRLKVGFDPATGPLCSLDGDSLKGFEVADAGGRWYPACAMIDGNQVILFNSEVADPVAMRYGWAPNPQATLYNTSHLPASPFCAGPIVFESSTKPVFQ